MPRRFMAACAILVLGMQASAALAQSWNSEAFGGDGDAPVAISASPYTYTVFVRGRIEDLWYRSANGNTAGPWTGLGGEMSYMLPDPVSWASDHMAVFVSGHTSNLAYKTWNGSTWSGWINRGGTLVGDPSAVSWGPSHMAAFGRGTDNRVWYQFYNGTWTGWQTLGGTTGGDPEAVSWGPNHITVFRTTGGGVGPSYRTFNGSTWTPWAFLGGSVYNLKAVSLRPGHIMLFGPELNRSLYFNVFDNGVWSGWQKLGQAIGVDVTMNGNDAVPGGWDVITRTSGVVDVFFLHELDRSQLKHMSFDGSTWTHESIAVPGRQYAPFAPNYLTAVASGPKRIDVFMTGVVGDTRPLYHVWADWRDPLCDPNPQICQ